MQAIKNIVLLKVIAYFSGNDKIIGNFIMTLIDINFSSYIPTTLLGLLGLISGYLFFYFKNKSDNKLKEIQSVNSKDRIRAIEMSLNELGVTIDTSTLSPEQKFILIKNLLKAKFNRYLIISLTLIIISLFVTFLIWRNNSSSVTTPVNTNDTINTIRNIITQEVLKAPPDIEEPDSTYPELYDGALVTEIKNGGSGCELFEEDDTVILVRVIQPNDADATSFGDYVLQDKKGVQEKYDLNDFDLSEAEKSWINTIMVVGRRLLINYAICGHGGYRSLTYVKPLRSYGK